MQNRDCEHARQKLKMIVLSSVQTSLFLVGIVFTSEQGKGQCCTKDNAVQRMLTFLILISAALAASCQMYPSEYAYPINSVTRPTGAGANCMTYPSGLRTNVGTEKYIHCDGGQLTLADSDLGSEQYRSSDYYVWNEGTSNRQLLFIFPTMVNLVTITLHYYHDSDSIEGRSHSLPRLKFYAVPETFYVWNALLASYRYVEVAAVPPGGEPAGHRNVSINVNFNTKKVLMQKFSSSFLFAVSEVEFFTCHGKCILQCQYLMIINSHANTAKVTTSM